MSIMSATRARTMELIGSGIDFDHQRQKLILSGNGRFAHSPPVTRILRARNVTVVVKKNYLVSPEGNGIQPQPVKLVEFEQRSDMIVRLDK